MRRTRTDSPGRAPLFLVLLCAAAIIAPGCTREVADDARPEPIAVIEGMRYYVGGPNVTPDAHGRHRIKGYAGEVLTPPSRGLVIGEKKLEGNNIRLMSWLDGRLVGDTQGFLDDGGFTWVNYQEGFGKQGLIMKRWYEHDDDAKVSRIKIEHIDPLTGEIIETEHQQEPYTPPVLNIEPTEEDLAFDKEFEAWWNEDEEGAEGGSPDEGSTP